MARQILNDENQWGIHWFRRDLRLPNNIGLRSNLKRTSGRTLGLFCFDSKFLSRPDFSHRRFAFFIETIDALRDEMKRFDGDLLVLDCLPIEAFSKIATLAKKQSLPLPYVTFNRDYEPFALDRDKRVSAHLTELGFNFKSHRDHLIFEPQTILKPDGTAYQKYSAFARVWEKRLHSAVGKRRIDAQSKTERYLTDRKKQHAFSLSWSDILGQRAPDFQDQLAAFKSENEKHVQDEIPRAGLHAAFEALDEFAPKLGEYDVDRSIPSIKGSSELSKFLKNGSLTLAQIIHHLGLRQVRIGVRNAKGKFLKELIWREYYFYILFHYPRVEHEAFPKKYDQLAWQKSQTHFEKWKRGETGVPIVDAGMRELNETGWINNRIRILVASYLTKDLGLNWQMGEQYFMNVLIDGDLAANNGNWQWVASTGSENQPYFRVMNPWTQSKRFDPDGIYIKRWLPELAECPTKSLHEEFADRSSFDYPQPLVPHAETKTQAIARFKAQR